MGLSKEKKRWREKNKSS